MWGPAVFQLLPLREKGEKKRDGGREVESVSLTENIPFFPSLSLLVVFISIQLMLWVTDLRVLLKMLPYFVTSASLCTWGKQYCFFLNHCKSSR